MHKIKKALKILQQQGFIRLVHIFFSYIEKFKNTELIPLINYRKNRLRFRSVAHPRKLIWIKPKDVNLWLADDKIKSKKHGAGGILDSDWDLDVRTIEQKQPNDYSRFIYKSIIEHFKAGVPWEKTELFHKYYAKQMKIKGTSKMGSRSMEDLVNYYNDKIDRLYDSIKKDGVLLPSKDRPEIDFLYVHVGRDGEIIWTDGGSHRLLICNYLNVDCIPVRVWWRHKKWQEIREKLNADRGQWEESWAKPYLNHPDLEDIFQPQK